MYLCSVWCVNVYVLQTDITHIYALGAVKSEWQSSGLFLYKHISAVVVDFQCFIIDNRYLLSNQVWWFVLMQRKSPLTAVIQQTTTSTPNNCTTSCRVSRSRVQRSKMYSDYQYEAGAACSFDNKGSKGKIRKDSRNRQQ